TGDALAAKAHIHAFALRLRRAGVPGSLDQLRLAVFADLTAGRDPLDRLTRPSRPPHTSHARPGEAPAAGASEPPAAGAAGRPAPDPRDPAGPLIPNAAGLDYDDHEADTGDEDPGSAPP